MRTLRPVGPRLLGRLDRLALGELARHAADRHGAVEITLDRPLELAPQLGLRIDYTTIAGLIEGTHARLAEAGIRPGDRVAIIRRNSFDTVVLACACVRLGALPALISADLAALSIDALLVALDRPTVIADPRTAGSLGLTEPQADIGPALTPGAGLELPSAEGSSAPPPSPRRPADPLIVTHTSGTTGTPKLVVHSARSLMAQVKPQLLLGAPFTLRSDRAAVCLTWSHARAIVCWAGLAARGLPMLALSDFDPDRVCAALAQFRPTIVETFPNAYVGWEAFSDHPAAPLAQVKVFFSTFDSAHPRTIERLLGASRRRMAFWAQVYGQSEIGPATMRLYLKRLPQRSNGGRNVGWPLIGFTRVRVTDTRTGAPVRGRRSGMIEVATCGRALGYLRGRGIPSEDGAGGWWRTGDIGQLTRTRALHFLDRGVDAIPGLHSGVALEDTLLERLPQAREIVVLSMDAGSLPVVCTQNDAPLAPEAWHDATRDLPPLLAPRQMTWSELPLTPTLKVRRLELRRRLAMEEGPQ